MKKIKLNTAKLQLNKEKIANLSNVEMGQLNGGIGFVAKKSIRNSFGCVCCPVDEPATPVGTPQANG
ncbi:MAG: class I lanthipeptide [Phycisphaerales bacterium]|nr:class I lanthipeptide [Phycisphaerales bacterium]